jgi:hypothetical protein
LYSARVNVQLTTTNRFPGRCCICGLDVPAQRGYLLRGDQVDDPKLSNKKWLTLCNTVQCVTAVVGEEAVAEADRRALLADGTIEMPTDETTKALRRAMGSWDGERRKWVASPLFRDRAHVLAIAAQLGLEVAPEFATYEDPELVRAAVARARAVPTIREYQVAGVRWLAYRGLLDGALADYEDKKPGGLLADGMGIGKTVQVLLSLHDDEALVVVCPANAKAVWPREAKKWRPDRFDTITVCEGEESFRWPTSTRELIVINYDVLPSTPAQIVAEKAALLAERHGAKPNPDGKTKAEREGQRGLLPQIIDLADDYSDLVHHDGGMTTSDRHLAYQLLCEWVKLSDKLHKNRRALVLNARRRAAGNPTCPVLLVFDEAHYAENNKAARTERCRHLAGKARRLYGLTGTPVDAEPLKLWGLLQTIRATPFSWAVFRECFSAFDGQWGGIDFLRHPPAPGSTARGPVIVQPGTTEILRRSMLRRTKDDPTIAAELPPKIFSEIPIALDEKLIRECDEIVAVYGDYLLRGELPPFEAVAGLRKALAQVCIPAMLEKVEEYEDAGTPLLVFSAHTGPIKALGKRDGWFTITGEVDAKTRGKIEDRFQGDSANNFAGAEGHGVGGTQAMCEAMTLTRASTVLQVDPFWKKSQNEQAYDRAHRIGQKNTVHVIRLVPDHVLVRHTADLLCGKDRFVSDVLAGEIKVEAPPSRFVRADEAEWNAAREAKTAEDRAHEEAAEHKRQVAVERELREAMQRDAERITPKLSEARAKARHERLAAEQHEDDAVACYFVDAPKAVVQEAFAFMQSVCDGAVLRDGDGFNKPDSCVAQWLAPGVAAGSKYATAAAANILRHYPRQLAERWPELFNMSR